MKFTNLTTRVVGQELFYDTYIRKSWLCFDYYVKVKSDSIQKEIIIMSEENPIVFLNGKKLN